MCIRDSTHTHLATLQYTGPFFTTIHTHTHSSPPYIHTPILHHLIRSYPFFITLNTNTCSSRHIPVLHHPKHLHRTPVLHHLRNITRPKHHPTPPHPQRIEQGQQQIQYHSGSPAVITVDQSSMNDHDSWPDRLGQCATLEGCGLLVTGLNIAPL